MNHFKLGDTVTVNPQNDNENYASFRNDTLIVSGVCKGEGDSPAYDPSMYGEYLYDLKYKGGKSIPFSLYDYELVKA